MVVAKLSPTCTLIRQGSSYLLALNKDGNDAARIAADDLAAIGRAIQALAVTYKEYARES